MTCSSVGIWFRKTGWALRNWSRQRPRTKSFVSADILINTLLCAIVYHGLTKDYIVIYLSFAAMRFNSEIGGATLNNAQTR
jgi:hypothetical protein